MNTWWHTLDILELEWWAQAQHCRTAGVARPRSFSDNYIITREPQCNRNILLTQQHEVFLIVFLCSAAVMEQSSTGHVPGGMEGLVPVDTGSHVQLLCADYWGR